MSIKKELKQTLNQMSNLIEKGSKTTDNYDCSGIRTGFPKLDCVIDGLLEGNLITLFGPTSIGKALFSLQIASYVANDYPVAFFSLNESTEDLIKVLLAQAVGIHLWKIKTLNFNAEDFKDVQDNSKKIEKIDLDIHDFANPTLDDIEKTIAINSYRLVVIDSLEMMDIGDERPADIYEYIAEKLKKIATKNNITIILNIRSKNRESTLRELRKFGNVEKNSDIVLDLNCRDDYVYRVMRILKNNNGYTKYLYFDLNKNRFIHRVEENIGDMDFDF
jgi:replicative DNA helicase